MTSWNNCIHFTRNSDGDMMRTFSEINNDIRKCKQNIENTSSKKEYFQCLALLDELECEKDRVWSTL